MKQEGVAPGSETVSRRGDDLNKSETVLEKVRREGHAWTAIASIGRPVRRRVGMFGLQKPRRITQA